MRLQKRITHVGTGAHEDCAAPTILSASRAGAGGETPVPPLQTNPETTREFRPFRTVVGCLIARANPAAIWYLRAFILLISLMEES